MFKFKKDCLYLDHCIFDSCSSILDKVGNSYGGFSTKSETSSIQSTESLEKEAENVPNYKYKKNSFNAPVDKRFASLKRTSSKSFSRTNSTKTLLHQESLLPKIPNPEFMEETSILRQKK